MTHHLSFLLPSNGEEPRLLSPSRMKEVVPVFLELLDRVELVVGNRPDMPQLSESILKWQHGIDNHDPLVFGRLYPEG